MRKALIILIRAYRYVISPMMGPSCRFYPTCSSYAMRAIELHGVFFGTWMTVKRILKCNPWHPGGCDPVPGDEQ